MKDIFSGEASLNLMIKAESEAAGRAPLQAQLGLKSFGMYVHTMTKELPGHFEMIVSDDNVLVRSVDDGTELELSYVKKSRGGQWEIVKLCDDFASDPPYTLTINSIPLSDVENKIIEHFTFWASYHFKGDDKKWENAIESACCQVSTINGQPSWGCEPL